ncbi:MAG: hypothetical protein RLZZ366_2384 [Pseudomonadota bacterium]|jgi:opacity protein-like surface antigen
MSIPSKRSFATASLIAISLAAPAQARKSIQPYLEVNQVATMDLKHGGDVLTYSALAAGVDASVSNNRSEIQMSYRYERRIGWGKHLQNDDVHSGLVRGSYQIIPQTLTFEAGALATRARSDIRQAAPVIGAGNVDNLTQVYSTYAGPTFATQVGDLNVGAQYRLAYTKAETANVVADPTAPQLDNFDHSVSHLATASVGMKSGTLPFGWTVSGAYQRDDAGQLDQRFESKGVQLDVIAPVSPTVAAIGAVGYEKITASQRDAVRDVSGNPVRDSRGRFITDSASPRLLAYDSSGLYWNVGVSWRPSSRTSLEARIGRRYNSWSYTGSFNHQLSEATAFQLGVFDGVQTFGRQLTDNLSSLPTNFRTTRNPLVPQFGGCVSSSTGNGAGGCLTSALQSITSSVFRSRGALAHISTHRGPLSAAASLGYTRRTFQSPVIGSNFSVNGVSDSSWSAEGDIAYTIDDRSSIDAAVFANLYNSGILDAPNVSNFGATSSYHRQFGRRLSGVAAVGLYTSRIEGVESDLTASGLIGMRYDF